jgi:Domain of unknown function (DUF4136)
MTRRDSIVTIAFIVVSNAVAMAGSVSQLREQPASPAERRTYVWARNIPLGNAEDDARIVAAVERQLAERHLAPAVPAADADLWVAYAVRIDRRVQVVAHSMGWSAARAGLGGPRATAMTQEVFAATLTIEVRDAVGGLVWRGTRSLDIDATATPESRGRGVDRAVARVLASLAISR